MKAVREQIRDTGQVGGSNTHVTSKERVLNVYPEARYVDLQRFHIILPDELDVWSAFIGLGKDEAEAWDDAASKLLASRVGGSNEFPKLEAERTCETCFMHGSARQHACERCFECPDKDGNLTFWESPYADNAAPIAPAAEELDPVTEQMVREVQEGAVEQQHIANLESELQMARDLIIWKDTRIEELERQLTAANLGSAMQHERYGSY